MSVLDRSRESDVAGAVLELREDTGYSPEEFIPGMMVATRELASGSDQSDQVLDEAVEILEEEEGEDYE